jgi:hypothetical protein
MLLMAKRAKGCLVHYLADLTGWYTLCALLCRRSWPWWGLPGPCCYYLRGILRWWWLTQLFVLFSDKHVGVRENLICVRNGPLSTLHKNRREVPTPRYKICVWGECVCPRPAMARTTKHNQSLKSTLKAGRFGQLWSSFLLAFWMLILLDAF